MSNSPDLRRKFEELIEHAVSNGWRVQDSGKHVTLYPPPITLARSPSDFRAYANMRSRLKRAGLRDL